MATTPRASVPHAQHPRLRARRLSGDARLCAHCGYPTASVSDFYCAKCTAWLNGDWDEVRAIDAGLRDGGAQ